LAGVGEGDAVADQPGKVLLVLGDLRGDLEGLGGVALEGDNGHLAAQHRAQVNGLRFLCTATVTSLAPFTPPSPAPSLEESMTASALAARAVCRRGDHVGDGHLPHPVQL
jgi:hypothetical protein